MVALQPLAKNILSGLVPLLVFYRVQKAMRPGEPLLCITHLLSGLSQVLMKRSNEVRAFLFTIDEHLDPQGGQ